MLLPILSVIPILQDHLDEPTAIGNNRLHENHLCHEDGLAFMNQNMSSAATQSSVREYWGALPSLFHSFKFRSIQLNEHKEHYHSFFIFWHEHHIELFFFM